MKPVLLVFALAVAAGTAAAQPMLAPAGSASEAAKAPLPTSAAVETAKRRIERDGYTDVRGLTKGPDGLWQGTAMRGNTAVQVTVDRAGNVAAK